MSRSQAEKYAAQATRPARSGDTDAVGAGLAAVAFALLDVAQAIREASGTQRPEPADDRSR